MNLQDEDRRLLARLRTLWDRRDPVPDGLVAQVLAALASEGIDEEYELLTLQESSGRLAGVRGDDDGRTLTFGSGDLTVMVRISTLDGTRRRVDGWISPSATYDVRLDRPGAEPAATTSAATGRFELADVPTGSVRLRFLATGEQGRSDVTPLWLTTPSFVL